MRPIALIALAPGGTAAATETATAAVSPTGSLIQVFLGLVVVLALMAAAAWALKRSGVARATGMAPVRIIGGASLGGRERVVVVEVGDQWMVIGVAPGRVNALGTMPKREIAAGTAAVPTGGNFAAWLRQSLERRHGK